MPPVEVLCEGCGKSFLASRSDSKWHSDRCRYKIRMEDAKFAVPDIPRSGIPGITFSRIRKRWQIAISEDGKMKYIGSRKTLSEAIALQSEVLGVNPGSSDTPETPPVRSRRRSPANRSRTSPRSRQS
jgi:hypothetical protein